MVCHYNSCTLPQLGASDVCFDLFGREQDLSVAYSRDGQIPEIAPLIKLPSYFRYPDPFRICFLHHNADPDPEPDPQHCYKSTSDI